MPVSPIPTALKIALTQAWLQRFEKSDLDVIKNK
jgi:hypothetical protein